MRFKNWLAEWEGNTFRQAPEFTNGPIFQSRGVGSKYTANKSKAFEEEDDDDEDDEDDDDEGDDDSGLSNLMKGLIAAITALLAVLGAQYGGGDTPPTTPPPATGEFADYEARCIAAGGYVPWKTPPWQCKDKTSYQQIPLE